MCTKYGDEIQETLSEEEEDTGNQLYQLNSKKSSVNKDGNMKGNEDQVMRECSSECHKTSPNNIQNEGSPDSANNSNNMDIK